ncbi:MAG: 16S rRNA (cytosine(1402)-N(4))-methyltransferase RsmH [Clostridia bacterium]|nr:16S rRNA (cytosine(1402)-N(4))-methyltransferase RsmH [Clostridia bacterium]
MEEKREFSHRSVLLYECMDGLDIKPDGIYVDGTAGGGGHSSQIARRLTSGRLIAIDRDEAAIRAAGERLSEFGERATVVRSNFYELARVCEQMNIEGIDGLLLDLGVSSHQLDTPERGFSYMSDAPLDMRMDKRDGLTAFDIVNGYTEERLKKILYEYGEERFSASIAAAIVRERQKKPIERTLELSDIIKYAIPPRAREAGHHPAKRSFQAIRIEVNGELAVIEPTIRDAARLLRRGGRIAIITFHSLEDRIVKQAFASLAEGCTCPRSFPVCVCGNKPTLKVITKKPILPSSEELEENPRSRSAKLRVAQKL